MTFNDATPVLQEFPTFCVVALDVTVGNNKSMLSIINNSVNKLKIKEIRLVNTQTTAITGQIVDFRLLRCASHGGGVLLTSQPFDTEDVLAGDITVRSGAMVGTEGVLPLKRWLWSSDEWGVGAQDVESAQQVMQETFPSSFAVPNCRPPTLNTGQGFTIKQINNVSAGTFTIAILFTVE